MTTKISQGCINIAGFSLLFIASFFVMQGISSAATLTVDTTADNTTVDGSCTLREAIGNANNDADTSADCAGVGGYGADTIEFDIAGAGPHVITLGSALPTIADDLIIDGSSETGASCGTLVDDATHTLLIEIDSSAVTANVFDLTGGDTTIRGLAIHSAQDGGGFGEGQAIRAGNGGANYTIECNYIGTDAAGTTVYGNETAGVFLLNVSTTTVSNNLIAGSSLFGITVFGAFGAASDVTISSNLIGADHTRSANASYANNVGINFQGAVTDSVIGGTASTDRNYVYGNTEGNIAIGTFGGAVADDVAVLGNHIYASPDDNGTGLTFAGLGIDLYADADGNQQPDNAGVTANDATDSDTGANGLLNFPVIASAVGDGTNTAVEFSLDVPAGDYRIEFFANDAADPTGYGEGQTFIGATTVTSAGSGSQDFSATLAGYSGVTNVTATTTEDLGGGSFGSTSEFSLAVASTVTEASSGSDDSDSSDSETLADTGLSNVIYLAVSGGLIIVGYALRRHNA